MVEAIVGNFEIPDRDGEARWIFGEDDIFLCSRGGAGGAGAGPTIRDDALFRVAGREDVWRLLLQPSETEQVGWARDSARI